MEDKYIDISATLAGDALAGKVDSNDLSADDLRPPYNRMVKILQNGGGEAEAVHMIGPEQVAFALEMSDKYQALAFETKLSQLQEYRERVRLIQNYQKHLKILESGRLPDEPIIFEGPSADGRTRGGTSFTDLMRGVDITTSIWKDWIPKGALTLIVGDQEAGKSNLVLKVCDAVANDLPLGDGSHPGATGKVVLIETEGRREQLYTRMQHWKVDPSKIVSPWTDRFHNPSLESPDDLQQIENCVVEERAVFLAVDSLMGGMGEENKPLAKRPPQKLNQLAERTDIGAIASHHPRKVGEGRTRKRIRLDDIRGFGGISGLVSSVIAVDQPGRNNDRQRRMYKIKGPKLADRGFEIYRRGGIWCFEWSDAPTPPAQGNQRETAKAILKQMCANGERLKRDIMEVAKEKGISASTMGRAKNDLHVKDRKEGLRDTYWFFDPSHIHSDE